MKFLKKKKSSVQCRHTISDYRYTVKKLTLILIHFENQHLSNKKMIFLLTSNAFSTSSGFLKQTIACLSEFWPTTFTHVTLPCFLYSWKSPSFNEVSEDLRGKFRTHIARGRLSSEWTTGWWLELTFDDDVRRLDFGEPVELVALDVDELDELLLLRDRDLEQRKNC